MVGTNGSECHSLSGPVGTTSVWPAKQTTGWALPRRAQRFATSPNFIGSHSNPARARRWAMSSWQPPSSGVTDLRAISSLASSSAPAGSGIHVDLEVAERAAAARRREDAFLLLLLGPALRHRLAGDLARGRLVDQPQHVGGRVGVRHRFVLGDLAVHEQLEERLLEGLRPGRHALLQRLLDLADLAPLDQLGDEARVEEHLARDHTLA